MTEYEIIRLCDRVKELAGENTDLKAQIADIKANCDLAIEGRDIKIKELEKQIEKMKCCENCKHKKSEVDRCELLVYTMNDCLCKNKDKWELRR